MFTANPFIKQSANSDEHFRIKPNRRGASDKGQYKGNAMLFMQRARGDSNLKPSDRLHEQLVADLQPRDIEAELDGMTPAVRNAFLRNLRAVFNFGVKRSWLEENPVSKLDFETINRGEVVTLTPKQAEKLLKAAELANDLLPYHALGRRHSAPGTPAAAMGPRRFERGPY